MATKQLTKLEVKHDGTRWTVREQGIGRLTSHADQQSAASAARNVAALHTPSELTIRSADGTVSSEESFPHR